MEVASVIHIAFVISRCTSCRLARHKRTAQRAKLGSRRLELCRCCWWNGVKGIKTNKASPTRAVAMRLIMSRLSHLRHIHLGSSLKASKATLCPCCCTQTCHIQLSMQLHLELGFLCAAKKHQRTYTAAVTWAFDFHIVEEIHISSPPAFHQ